MDISLVDENTHNSLKYYQFHFIAQNPINNNYFHKKHFLTFLRWFLHELNPLLLYGTLGSVISEVFRGLTIFFKKLLGIIFNLSLSFL